VAACVVILTSGCVTSPLDGQEVANRHTDVFYQLVYREVEDPPNILISFLDQDGNVRGSQSGGLASTGFLRADALGTRWNYGRTTLQSVFFHWYPNTDSSHPGAKWMTRLRFAYQPYTGGGGWGNPTPNYTFKGNPDGSLSAATGSCLNSWWPAGGVAMGANCGQGDTVTIYAIND
jgi:hypothetical protein